MTINCTREFVLKECLKTLIVGLITALVIYRIELSYEATGHQFMLIDKNNPTSNYCRLYSDKLVGVVDINFTIPTYDELNSTIKNLQPGGLSRPVSCKERQKLAIIIPYRDRLENLLLLLKYLHPFLQRQEQYYQIFVVEQYGDDIFNKGRIMNIAAYQASLIDNFDCFIFHDVDLIPENDFNIYDCYEQPRHLCPAIDELRYTLMYYNLVGGVLALSKDQLERTNGFSNLYWGWGAEDDDMSMRILNSGYDITRPLNKIGRYKMILHKKRSRALNRFHLLNYWSRYNVDGINSVNTLNYTIKEIENLKLYTHVMVDIGPSKIEQVGDQYTKVNFKFY